MSFILKNKFALLCKKIVSVNSSAAQICGHFASKRYYITLLLKREIFPYYKNLVFFQNKYLFCCQRISRGLSVVVLVKILQPNESQVCSTVRNAEKIILLLLQIMLSIVRQKKKAKQTTQPRTDLISVCHKTSRRFEIRR